jgi:signal transduction histidine kinase
VIHEPSPASRLFRPTLRLRLTAIYTLLFLGVGVVLLGLTYLLLRNALPGKIPDNVPIPAPSGMVAGHDRVEHLSKPLQEVVLSSLLVQSSIALAVVTALAVAVGWLMAGRALRPVHRITATARRLSEATLDERIALAGPEDELKELADTFDAMLDRLDAAFDSQRRFVANASHELRTPLATQRTLIDVSLRDRDAGREDLRTTMLQLRDLVDGNDRLIESLLVLARSERGLERREPVDLSSLADLAVQRAAAEAERRHVAVRCRAAPAVVAGDAALLERLAENLVQNAIRHNAAGGGWAEVTVRTGHPWAVLAVANSGEPVPPTEVPALFEPFRRLGTERTGRDGVGLGLSIVRAVAQAHGGTVLAEARPEGGLVVAARLPLAGEASLAGIRGSPS